MSCRRNDSQYRKRPGATNGVHAVPPKSINEAKRRNLRFVAGRGAAILARAMRNQIEQVARDSRRLVTRNAGFLEIIAENRNYPEGLDRVQVVDDLAGPFAGVLGLEFIRYRSPVDES